ncbi:transcriptional regulator, GntR family with aminotransferase domain protein [Kribbella flavida DSM 17836]|uniref:Transcriptional regulator, GntR family with aminotransferase domain protein n=1 Tax=Kribbella flavida (strain DSM 17836 / JCM 10339 / NBRC 14399) TaxID=479435 RepID=D2PP58_KRIFD|nr:PLP-dependent aminotransferase family protein [Kribbella flavida]ADB34654.1 transcriptional regulator, GntR family with aminotransferase domain protein [Kribbella flavida DSM 17836]
MTAQQLPASTLIGLLGAWSDATGPAYRALSERLRLLIADGRIMPGSRLPSERELTDALGVSRTTVASAYRELRDRGYLTSRRGSGSVTALPSKVGPELGRHHAPGIETDGLYDFTCAASPAAPGISTAVTEALEGLPYHLATPGYHPQGLPELRAEIAAAYDARGLPTSADQIVVTGGALAATCIAVRAMTQIGDRVLTESPTHPNSVDAIRRSGARVVAAPMSPDGWDLPLLEATIRQTAPRAAWLVVDFQNPTGRLMPAADRQRLAIAFARSRTTAIVDETLFELALDGQEMPPPFAAFDPSGVITVGSVSKSFWGGLRIGWLRVPETLVARILDARASMDLGAPVLEQLVVTRLLRDRATILPERRAGLRERRDALAGALREVLPEWRFTLPGGGLSLWCELPAAVGSSLVGVAQRNGVLLVAGSRFSPEGGLETFMRLPYTQDPDTLRHAASLLAASYEQLTERPAARRTAALIA